MVFCSKCGKELPENAYFCPTCGVKTAKGVEASIPLPSGNIISEIGKETEKASTKAAEETNEALDKAKEVKPDGERIQEMIASLEQDILTGKKTELTGRSYETAVELSKIGEPAVEPLIQSLPRSSYAHLALGLIGGERAFQALCRELQTGSWRRIEAGAKALGQIGDPRALRFLKPHTVTSSAEVSSAVTNAIAKIERAQIGEPQWLQVDRKNPSGQVKRVGSMLHEIKSDASLREKAIRWHREFVAAMPELKFSSEQERGNTWAILGTLIFYFLNPEETNIHGLCPEAAYCYEQCLKYTSQRSDVQLYLKGVRSVRPPRVSLEETLESIRNETSVEKLIRALAIGGPYRELAEKALEKIGEPAVEALVQTLKDKTKPGLHSVAVQALGKIGNARAVEPLIQALEDEDGTVRMHAAATLGELGDTRAVEPLIQALNDSDWRVRWWAAKALGKIGDLRAVEPLIQALKDEDERVREWAKEALEKIRAKN